MSLRTEAPSACNRTHALLGILEECVDTARHQNLSLNAAFERLGDTSFSFICIVLTLPFIQPVPLGPLTVLGGLNFMALGFQLALGHQTPWVPRKLKSAQPPQRVWVAMLRSCEWILKFCGRLTKRRFTTWVTGVRGRRLCGSLIFAGGGLMAIPFGGLPLNNALPALMILFACIAELEEDGLMLIVSLFWGALS